MSALREQLKRYKEENQKFRLKDAVKFLNVSEEEIITVDEALEVCDIGRDFAKIFDYVKKLGKVRAISRTRYGVMSTEGIFKNVKIHGMRGVTSGPGIDIRLQLYTWNNSYAVKKKLAHKEEIVRSIQFCNQQGKIAHKIDLTEDSNIGAFDEMINDLGSSVRENLEHSNPPKEGYKRLEDIDSKAFQSEWKNITSAHSYYGVRKDFEISRITATRAVEGVYSRRVDRDKFKEVFQQLVEKKIPYRFFMRNKNVVHACSGVSDEYSVSGDWLTLAQKEYSFHLNDSTVYALYIVEQPSFSDGRISIEAYDSSGHLICNLSKEKDASEQEEKTWNDFVSQF